MWDKNDQYYEWDLKWVIFYVLLLPFNIVKYVWCLVTVSHRSHLTISE